MPLLELGFSGMTKKISFKEYHNDHPFKDKYTYDIRGATAIKQSSHEKAVIDIKVVRCKSCNKFVSIDKLIRIGREKNINKIISWQCYHCGN